MSVAYAQAPLPPAVAPSPFSYADAADLATRADVIAVARVKSLSKLAQPAANQPAGTQRYYVQAQVDSLIRGEAGLATRIAFVMDFPLDINPNRTIKNRPTILFGRAGGRPGEFQLLSNGATLPWSPGADAQVRGIVKDVVATDAPPEISRIVEAFHVEGTIAGESETQIFLGTRSGQPISLSVIRRPNEEPRFGAALGEIVDEAADVPKPDTLLWYRLACSLPPALPMAAVAKLDMPGAEAASADYKSFLTKLGRCARSRPPVLGK